jgi:hypothetical protein
MNNVYLFDALRIAFFKNPRTASSSMLHWLRDNNAKQGGTKYDDVHSLQECCQKEDAPKSYFSFGFVRNPYERMASLYFWGKDRYFPEYVFPPRFDKFVIDIIVTTKPKNIHWEQQHILISKLDFVGRYENIEKDIEFLKHKFDLTDLSENREASRVSNYHKHYTNITKKLIYNFYRKDFEIFRYES